MSNKQKKSLSVRVDEQISALFELSLEEARKLLMAGKVRWKSKIIDKPGTKIKSDDHLEIVGQKKYVSRAGHKIEKAWELLKFPIKEQAALDIGLSTGGFSDFLLQHDASHVLGVDVGLGLVDEKVRRNPHMMVMEKTNARYLNKVLLSDFYKDKAFKLPVFDLVVIDVSFISVFTILATLKELNAEGVLSVKCNIIAMIKPQFEIAKELVPPGGVLSDEAREQCLKNVFNKEQTLGLNLKGKAEAGIRGKKGNLEEFRWYTFH